MVESRKRAQNFVQPVFPPLHEVQQRFLSKMKEALNDSLEKVSGEDSEVGRRVLEIEGKVHKAKTIARKYENLLSKNPGDLELKSQYDLAIETVGLFEGDLTALRRERENVLVFFREVEAFIPEQYERLEQDELAVQLAELRGEAMTARTVSKEIVLKALQPIAEKFIPLNEARERLLLHSVATLEGGPGTIRRLIEEAETSEERKSGLERKLTLVADELSA
jgi:hypothetical protein